MKKHLLLTIVSVIFLSSCSKKLAIFDSKAERLVTTYKLWSTTQFYSIPTQQSVFTPYIGPRDSAYNNKKGDVVKVNFAGGEFIVPAKTLGTIDGTYKAGGNLSIDFAEEFNRKIFFKPDVNDENGNFRVIPGSFETITVNQQEVYDEGGESMGYSMDTIRTSVTQDDATVLSDKKVYTVSPKPFYLYYCPKDLMKQIKSSTAKGKKVNNK